MLLSTVSASQITTNVWAAAARTLTADPATDAGAATFVWGHAARTLTADPATDAGAAALVWNRTTAAPAGGSFGALINLQLDAAVSSRAAAATALSTATWTAGRAGNLDNLDATVSSRAANATALSTATWTAGRAGNLDSLDATVSSRAAAATALSTATWTAGRAGNLDNIAGGAVALAATALSTATWSAARAGYIDSMQGAQNSEVLQTSLASTGVYSAITAAAAHSVVEIHIVVTQNAASNVTQTIWISIGGAGAEVDKIAFTWSMNAVGYACSGAIKVNPTVFAKGTRIAAHVNGSATATVVGITLHEIND